MFSRPSSILLLSRPLDTSLNSPVNAHPSLPKDAARSNSKEDLKGEPSKDCGPSEDGTMGGSAKTRAKEGGGTSTAGAKASASGPCYVYPAAEPPQQGEGPHLLGTQQGEDPPLLGTQQGEGPPLLGTQQGEGPHPPADHRQLEEDAQVGHGPKTSKSTQEPPVIRHSSRLEVG